ncbi:vacuolar cation/proton exchanger 3-like isoform X1 [Canna indica]|uniref:Vacuolar cation/proton exchanger n=1 Tax=Canna indica TaxID=4628 RepID=A0AAQ3QG21_9LILI|nr:vacuolar cation/proton exchanger 3-like isoform X1 [Canna indica]
MASEMDAGCAQVQDKVAVPAAALPQWRTAHNLSSSSMRKRSDLTLPSKLRWDPLHNLLANLQAVLLGTKLFPLFLFVPLAIAAHCFRFGQAWVFSLSLIGLVPLAERMSFLSEQIAYYAGPTVGGLLNATCGNAPELIIALLALHQDKIGILKWSLLGSIISNLLLVLGSSLFFGGLANLNKERQFDKKQADVNLILLLLACLCHILVLTCSYIANNGVYLVDATSEIELSRTCSVAMLVSYIGCMFFQLMTHRQLFESQEDDDDDIVSDAPAIGFGSTFVWLIGMTIFVTVLSNYVVSTIEAASESWGMPISFMSVILLPIVGNATEHAGAVIFAFKNKIDITLGVSLGSAAQISLFLIPLTTVVAWIRGIPMDLNFMLLETITFVLAIFITTFTLQVK